MKSTFYKFKDICRYMQSSSQSIKKKYLLRDFSCGPQVKNPVPMQKIEGRRRRWQQKKR